MIEKTDRLVDDYDLSYTWFNPATMRMETTDDPFKALTTGLEALEAAARGEPVEEFRKRYE